MAQMRMMKQDAGAEVETGHPGLAVHRLVLSYFRNYQNARLELPEGFMGPVVLIGQNGSGKTNLLEALSFLMPGRGMRSAKLSDVCHIGAAMPWAVAARVQGRSDEAQLGTGLDARTMAAIREKQAETSPDDDDNGFDSDSETLSERRVVKINGEAASGPAALSDHMSVTWVTPRMDRLFLEGASVRRRFFDRIVSGLHGDHNRHLNAYEKAMRERMRLISDRYKQPDTAWVSALERRAAAEAVIIVANRLDALAHLRGQIDDHGTGPFPKADLALDGVLEAALSSKPALEVEELFRQILADNRGRDGASGRAHDGPHKSDFTAFHVAKEMPARMCSTGEQKALVLGIVLAAARMERALEGHAPIILLDEVAAHLDQERRAALFDELQELGSQVWLTGTEAALFSPLQGKAAMFNVCNGEISPLAGNLEE